MPKIDRDQEQGPKEVRYTVMLNVVVQGSKKMDAVTQDEHIKGEPDGLTVTLHATGDPKRVLYHAEVPWSLFKPNDAGQSSIGFKVQETGTQFPSVSE